MTVANRRRRLDPDVVRRWVEDSCVEQGVDVKVIDPTTVHQVAILLGAGREPVRAAKSVRLGQGRSSSDPSRLDRQ